MIENTFATQCCTARVVQTGLSLCNNNDSIAAAMTQMDDWRATSLRRSLINKIKKEAEDSTNILSFTNIDIFEARSSKKSSRAGFVLVRSERSRKWYGSLDKLVSNKPPVIVLEQRLRTLLALARVIAHQ